jgi:hypothetical protein
MSDDETEKIKEMWAYHMPCVLLVQKVDYWPKLKIIYQDIFMDISVTIKKSLASSLLEITKINMDEAFMT